MFPENPSERFEYRRACLDTLHNASISRTTTLTRVPCGLDAGDNFLRNLEISHGTYLQSFEF